MSEPLNEFPKYIFEDLMKAIKEDSLDGVVRAPHRSPIALSCHIECHRSIHQGHFGQLAGFGSPIVFSNTCSSSHELAVNFLSAGARGYIGTLWKVGNEEAKQAAIAFYRSVFQEHNVLLAFHGMLQSIESTKYANVYVYWGFHFSTLNVPSEAHESTILEALMFLWNLWLRKVATTKDEVVRRNALPILRFLAHEILAEIEDKGIKPPEDFDEGAVSNLERSLPHPRERTPLLESNEIDLS